MNSAISRVQEYRADERAAVVVSPEAMISGLLKLEFNNPEQQRLEDMLEPLSTHPTTKNRIERLQKMDVKTPLFNTKSGWMGFFKKCNLRT